MSRPHFRHFLALVAANGLFGNVVGLFLPIYFQRVGLTGLQSGVYGIAKVFKVDKIGGCAAFVSLFTAVGSLLGSPLCG